MKGLRVVFVCLFFSLVALTGYAQVDYATATLRGTVVDPQGAIVAVATVTVTNPSTGSSRTIKTGSDGVYQFLALPPGTYQISVEARGFQQKRIIELTVGETVTVDMKLLAAGGDVLSQPGLGPIVETGQSAQSNAIEQVQIEHLPNLDRNITQAVYTLPGVSNADAARNQQPGFTSFGTTGFSIGGGNGRNVLSTIDGGDNEYGTGSYRWVNPPLEAIQEYQVNRNAYDAQFGFTNGAAINIVSKNGTNVFHGDVFGDFRNHSTSAANFFNGLVGLPKAYSQNVYTGGTLGGPIVKEKLFFFLAYEYQKADSRSYNLILNAPTVQGLSLPGLGTNCPAQFTAKTPDQLCYINALKTSGDPFLVGFGNGITPGLTPLNNPALNQIVTRDNGVFGDTLRRHDTMVRFDAHPDDADTVNLRLGYSHNLTSTTYSDGNSLYAADFNFLATWDRAFSPAVENDALVQVVPLDQFDARPRPFTGVNFTLGSLNAVGFAGPSLFNVGMGIPNPSLASPLSSFGSPSTLPYTAHQRRYQFEDNLAWIVGKHTLKFGGSYRAADYHLEDDLWFNNQFDFKDGFEPLIALAPAAVQGHLVAFNLTHGLPATGPSSTNLSAPQSFAFGIPADVLAGFNNPKWSGWGHYFGGYVQDNWRLNQQLTVNAGVRFDYDGEPSPIGSNIYASPRVGFAWDPFGDAKTVIRAGGGLYMAPVDFLVPFYGSLLNGNGTYINEVYSALSPTNPTVAKLWQTGIAKGELPFGSLTPADYAAVGLNTAAPGATIGNSVAPGYKNPYTVAGSLSVAREIVRNTSFEIAYNIYHGVHLQQPVETAYAEMAPGDPLCPSPACTDATGGPLYKPTTGQLQHTSYQSGGSSIYHGMTASLTRRHSNNLEFQVNYTWSKTIDNTLDFSGFQNWFRPGHPNLFRAVSAFDVTHMLVASAVYTTPFKTHQGVLSLVLADISLAPIVTVRSGLPFSVRTPTLNNIVNGRTLDNGFAMPFGASRDNNRGPGYATVDLRLTKAIFINRDRGVRVDFTAEGTNIFNRTNFNRVNDVFDVGGFPASGIVTTPTGTLNLLTGPYKGLKGAKPTNLSQYTQPLYYSSADAARQIQFEIKVAF